jgi:hypothetical protein
VKKSVVPLAARPEIIPELTLEFGADSAIGRIGDLAFRVPRSMLVRLADRGQVEEAFKQAREGGEPFKDIDSLETFVHASRLVQKGLDLRQAAKVMNIDGEKFVRYWNYALGKYPRKSEAFESEFARQGEGGVDSCATASVPTPYGPAAAVMALGDQRPLRQIFIEATQVAALRRSGADDTAIVAALRVDHKSFDKWLSLNRDVLEVLL